MKRGSLWHHTFQSRWLSRATITIIINVCQNGLSLQRWILYLKTSRYWSKLKGSGCFQFYTWHDHLLTLRQFKPIKYPHIYIFNIFIYTVFLKTPSYPQGNIDQDEDKISCSESFSHHTMIASSELKLKREWTYDDRI